MEPANRMRSLAVVPSGRTADSLADLTDDELMLLTRGGTQQAFDTLVRRHQLRALRVALRFLGEPTAAKDAAQSAFLELYRARQAYQPCGKFTAYLCRIVLNQCRMSKRGAHHRWREQVDPADLCTQELLTREHNRDLQRALDCLSEKLRAVVILRYGEDLNLAEIAESLELPLGTVKRRLFDAMAMMRESMESTP
jgi:RNA polymerase sigma-70 factor, ECF subfamily